MLAVAGSDFGIREQGAYERITTIEQLLRRAGMSHARVKSDGLETRRDRIIVEPEVMPAERMPRSSGFATSDEPREELGVEDLGCRERARNEGA